jgi:hypothetical protein
MPNRDLPVSGMQVLALDVEIALTEAALVAEVLGVSPGPADAEHDGNRSDVLRLPEQGGHQRPLERPGGHAITVIAVVRQPPPEAHSWPC